MAVEFYLSCLLLASVALCRIFPLDYNFFYDCLDIAVTFTLHIKCYKKSHKPQCFLRRSKDEEEWLDLCLDIQDLLRHLKAF